MEGKKVLWRWKGSKSPYGIAKLEFESGDLVLLTDESNPMGSWFNKDEIEIRAYPKSDA